MKQLVTGMLVLVLAFAPSARAAPIATDAAHARSHVKAMLERPELAAQLRALGLAPRDAMARVDAMSDAEVQTLAGRIDAYAAGGDLANQTPLILVILILVLLVLVI